MAESRQLKLFLEEYGKALDDRTAALFIGAGLSVPAGYKSWSALIEDLASDVELDFEREHDFVTLAQFYFNHKGRIRSELTQKLEDTYGQKRPFTENHRLLSHLPIETVWTTNYDPLIEDAFEATGKVVDVKRTSADLTKHRRGRDITVYKMHGDATQLEEAVLIKDDYELYNKNREFFTTLLRGDLLSKSFLFLGFSFTDPNIDYILSRIRASMGEHIKTHYCIMKWVTPTGDDEESKAQYRHDKRRQELLIEDMKWNGIKALMVDDYSEITAILKELTRKTHRHNIFVSGSAAEYGPMDEDRVLNIANAIGERLIKEGYNLVSGFGPRIGTSVLNSALQAYYRKPHMALADRIIMRTFPQYQTNGPEQAAIYTKHRRDMLSTVGYAVFLCGNKKDSNTAQIVPAAGVMEEFAIAKEYEVVPIPIGATGYAAKDIWDEVSASAAQFFRGKDVGAELTILGDPTSSNEQIVDAVFSIISQTSK